MKTLHEKLCFIATILLLWLAPQTLFAQGKSQIAVRDGEGKPIAGVKVNVYEGGTGVCKCDGNSCVVCPTDSDVSDKNGMATFRGGKNRPNLKPNTDYVAAIGDMCQTLRLCANPPQDCHYIGAVRKFTTDKTGKFNGFQLTQ